MLCLQFFKIVHTAAIADIGADFRLGVVAEMPPEIDQALQGKEHVR